MVSQKLLDFAIGLGLVIVGIVVISSQVISNPCCTINNYTIFFIGIALLGGGIYFLKKMSDD